MSDFAPDYVDVAERLRLLRDKHPDASLSGSYELVDVNGTTHVVYRAECWRSPEDTRPGVGFAWEQVPGKTPFTRGSELMNAETSAWGRAIVAALAADTKRVASADEMRRSTQEDYASTDALKDIGAALRALPTELRARVKAEVTDVWGPPDHLLASDVDDVLEHIKAADEDAAPFVANEDGTPAPTLIPSDNGDVRVKDTKAL